VLLQYFPEPALKNHGSSFLLRPSAQPGTGSITGSVASPDGREIEWSLCTVLPPPQTQQASLASVIPSNESTIPHRNSKCSWNQSVLLQYFPEPALKNHGSSFLLRPSAQPGTGSITGSVASPDGREIEWSLCTVLPPPQTQQALLASVISSSESTMPHLSSKRWWNQSVLWQYFFFPNPTSTNHSSSFALRSSTQTGTGLSGSVTSSAQPHPIVVPEWDRHSHGTLGSILSQLCPLNWYGPIIGFVPPFSPANTCWIKSISSLAIVAGLLEISFTFHLVRFTFHVHAPLASRTRCIHSVACLRFQTRSPLFQLSDVGKKTCARDALPACLVYFISNVFWRYGFDGMSSSLKSFSSPNTLNLGLG